MRPLFKKSLSELSEIVERNQFNIAELELVRGELRHRQTDGARRLALVVEERMSAIKSGIEKLESDKRSQSENTRAEVSDEVREWTNEAVAKLRAKLIDLSRKSPLISFRHVARSASQLRVVDERPDLLWQALENAPMGFEPLPSEDETPPDELTDTFQIAYGRAQLVDDEYRVAIEGLGDNESDARAWQDAERALRAKVRAELGLPKLNYGKGLDVAAIARAHGFDPSFELKFSDEEGVEQHHEDENIRVLLTQKELDKRLKTIWDRAGTHLRETGLHTLHLVFGFVQWFEDDASDIPNIAPLLLLPVALQREVKRGRYEYNLRSQGEGLEVNISLIEKARAHWGIQLPELREDESPESYFIRAKAILEKGRRLKLNCFVTLAVLPPMVLWKDLDPASWPEDFFARHRLLPGLLGAKDFHQSNDDDEWIDIDDPAHVERVPALITDADASQHRAIMDMAAGHDMAIEGPPGTGKSQTITNMIATALAQGKRILFVAEKQAALRVVADRLRSAGFGPLLLELHGDRAVRADVYEGIRERLDYYPNYDHKFLEIQRKDLKRHREMLRSYLSLIRTPLGNLERTAHELVWRHVRLRSLFEHEQIAAMEARWQPSDPSETEPATLAHHRELLEQYGKAFRLVSSENNKRSRWTFAAHLDAFNQGNAIDAAGTAAAAAGKVAEGACRLAALGLSAPGAGDDLADFVTSLTGLSPFTSGDEHIVRSALRAEGMVVALLNAQAQWHAVAEKLSLHIRNPAALTTDVVSDLAEGLAIDNCPATPFEVAASRQRSEQLLGSLNLARRDIDRLVEQLANGAATKIELAAEVTEKFGQLAALPAESGALLRVELAEPIAIAVASAAESEASAIRAERTMVLELSSSEALKTDPSELEATAMTLEATSFLGRLGGTYRAAKRNAARLLGKECDRLVAIETLRRVASLVRDAAAFEQSSKAKQLFPELLWNGIDSDFAGLREACETLVTVSSALARLDEGEALSWWLKSDSAERQRFSASCARISNLLAEAIEVDLGATAFGELASALEQRVNGLRHLEVKAEAAGLRPNAPLHWEGRSVAEHAGDFLRLKVDFDRFRSHDELAWVGSVEEDLSELQTTVEELGCIETPAGHRDLLEVLGESPEPAELMRSWVQTGAKFAEAVETWEDAAGRLEDLTDTEISQLAGVQNWPGLAEQLSEMADDRHGASLAADLLKYRKALIAEGLEAFGDFAAEGHVEPERLDDLYELLTVSALLQDYLGGDGNELANLGSLTLDAARKAFRRTDKELHKLEAAAIVAARLRDPMPQGRSYGRRSDYTDMGLIRNEIELTRPRTPLRDVVHRAGSALMAMKPVWMMSPTSVAQFIRPGDLSFDLLIVDEASQMRPEFSLSCMLRGDQFVVVGDANQLPPSDHFQMGGVIDDDDDDGVGVDENTESILDLANQRFRKKPRLKWHYRSQHESLIQFSNRQFYDRDLIVFPSPSANDDELMGVKCTYVPAKHGDTKYESSINQREAEEVIEQAFSLMQRYPECSIGIVAMNAKQTELIQNEFDRLTVENAQVRKYVEAFEGTVDEFFIKNLENVQGDERDIILISTVYGPGADGKVRQNFGLMNREVGWRRLNVLVTRAKLSCRLVTSLRPDDVKVTETSSRGVLSFKQYLTYAHNGAQYDDASGGETDSDFEIFVADAIRDAGYEVVYQVGVENFRIDLGVRHPSCPIGFIAGIECDGARYHSGLSVRDRDHIRQSVLEGLGWRIYRVWSTDWFANAARETAKLVAWLDAIREEVGRKLTPAKPQLNVEQLGLPAVILGHPQVQSPDRTQLELSDLPVEDVVHSAAPAEPRGRKLRPLGDIEPYEVMRGTLYELWRNDVLLGEVEVLKRATGIARLYGDGLRTSLPEYEGRVAATQESFKSKDLYAAMREVAARAAKAEAA